MSCNPLDISINLPEGPSGVPIPGFGVPFSLNLNNINPFIEGFPEDLMELFNKLQMLVPSGVFKPTLNPNFSKDIFDTVMSLIDKFLPFLMLYKFFLPVLRLLLCIIEVLCAIKNPFKLIKAMKRLFRRCLPDFLNLFPIYALIMMILSLLMLLLAIIQYIIEKIIELVKLILRNIIALNNAIKNSNDNSILAIARKIGTLLCMFQNLFVILAVFNIIFQIFRDILNMTFSIPPCDDTDPSDAEGCCTPDVCPNIVKNQVQRKTGVLKYIRKASGLLPISGPVMPFYYVDIRNESWQLFDLNQSTSEMFRNIFDGYDVVTTPKPVFFPTDVVYSSTTPVKQAAYTMDLRFYYNPVNWGRTGVARWLQFKDCIVISVPSDQLNNYDNTTTQVYNGVMKLGGGLGYEDNGTTPIMGYDTDGYTKINKQATLDNFMHMSNDIVNNNVLLDDGYITDKVEYILKPNLPVLLSKDIITNGCISDIAVDKTFVNNVLVGDVNITLSALGNAMKTDNGFPDVAATQECLSTAISGLKGNLSEEGLAQFQSTITTCLSKLQTDTENTIGKLVGLGYDPCKSKLDLSTNVQFTSRPIIVKVNINERNGTSLVSSLTEQAATNIAARIKPYLEYDKGNITNFVYDGYQTFAASLTSKKPVKGTISVSFDDQVFCTNTMPENLDESPIHALQVLDYQFIYAPGTIGSTVPTAEGDMGQPRRDESDISNNYGSSSIKD